LNDPNMQQEMAQRHLQAALTNSEASDPAQRSPEPRTVSVSGIQAAINKQLGLDEATFIKFTHA